MKKIIRLLFILLLLGLGFLYIVKNPDLGISQTILKAIGLERLLVSNEEISMGTGTFTLDEIGATFTLPVGREMQTPPVNVGSGTTFMISTPEQDNKKYQIFIRGSLDQNMDSLENIAKTYNTTLVTGQTFTIACDGVSPSVCLGIYENGNVYVIGFSTTSQQPQASDVPSTFVVPRYAQIKNAIDAMVKSIVVVPPVMTGSELTGEIQKEFINTDFVNDGTSVSYKGTKINIDANSFKLLSDIFFKDKNNIYTMAYISDGEYKLKKIDTINPTTFQIINDMFVKDDAKVYAVENSEEIKLIPLQADVNSSYVSNKFPEILSDKNNTVYYQNNKFTGISMQELENQITEHGADFIIANNNVYINTAEMGPFNEYMILPGADSQTFKKSSNINSSAYEDKNNKYDIGGGIIK